MVEHRFGHQLVKDVFQLVKDGDHDDEVLEQAIIGGAEGVASTNGCVAGLLLGASGSALLQTSAS